MGKKTKNKGKLFNCCCGKCGFWELVGDGESNCESSVDSAMSIDAVINESIADVTGIFTSSLHLSDDQEFKLSVKVTICKNASTMEVNGKGKA